MRCCDISHPFLFFIAPIFFYKRTHNMRTRYWGYIFAAGIFFTVSLGFLLPEPDTLFAKQKGNAVNQMDLVQQGSVLYQKYCNMCHGDAGEGYRADRANALANQDFLVSASDEYILEGILRGRPGTPMSAWGITRGGILSRTDAEAILAFMRTWQQEPSVDLRNTTLNKGNAENGAKLYERWCAACHGKYGKGGTATKLDNPVFQETATDAFIRYAIENGRRGTQMKAYKNIFSSEDTDDVVAYLRTFNKDNGFKETEAAVIEELAQKIRETAVIHPENPPADFSLINDRFIAADAVYAAYTAGQSFIILDARPGSDYLRSHIKGAISIPFYDVENAVGLLPTDKWIVAYCACPHALSGKALDTLKAGGYDKIGILNEGFFYWLDKGYPSESRINSAR